MEGTPVLCFFYYLIEPKFIKSEIFVLLQTLSCTSYSGAFFDLWTYLSHSIIEEQKKQWQKRFLNVLCNNQSRCDHTEFFFQNQNICRSIWKVLWLNAIYIISAGKKNFAITDQWKELGVRKQVLKMIFLWTGWGNWTSRLTWVSFVTSNGG